MESQITYSKASSIKIGDHLCINNFPCKCVNVSTSKTGKHGSCKCHFTGVDIVSGKKYEVIYSSTKDVPVPIITKKDYQLIDLVYENDITYSSLYSMGQTIDHIKLPQNEMGEQIKNNFDKGDDLTITVMSVLSNEIIVSFKINK